MDLFALHRLATRFGEGLRPELAEALMSERHPSGTVVPFQPPIERVPPISQSAPESELRDLGIAILRPRSEHEPGPGRAEPRKTTAE